MQKLAIIGANEFQQRLIRRAKEMGIETHVFAWREGAVGAADADRFYPISITEREEILEICRNVGIDGITSIASDLAVVTVNYVAEKLGLPGNGIDTIAWCTNKYEMRRRLMEEGIPVPRFVRAADAREADLTGFSYPIIVKPTDRSGSRCITKIDAPDAERLARAVREAAEVSFEKRAIIEEYLPGDEFSCESISHGGRHTVLAITRKFTTGAPHYIETGHTEPADLTREQEKAVRNHVVRALTALGIRTGASHAEFKLQGDEVRIIEIGARMGGDYIGSDLVRLSTGRDFVRMVIDTALGRAPDLTVLSEPRRASVRFILCEEDVETWREFRKTHGVAAESDIENAPRTPVTDSGSRWGYYIYTD